MAKLSRSETKAASDAEVVANRAAAKMVREARRGAAAAAKAAAAQDEEEDEDADEEFEVEDEDDDEERDQDEQDDEEDEESERSSAGQRDGDKDKQLADLRARLQALQTLTVSNYDAQMMMPLGEGKRLIYVIAASGRYVPEKMTQKTFRQHLRAEFGIAMNDQLLDDYERGYFHLIPLPACVRAPVGWAPVTSATFTDYGYATSTSAYKATITSALEVVQAIKQYACVARAFWGPEHPRTRYFFEFADLVMTEMSGLLAISMHDAINWWNYNSLKYLTSLARLDSEEIRDSCKKLDLTAVHQTAAAQRAAADRRAEPKSGRARERDGRQSRERSRERSPQHRFQSACRDYNAGRCKHRQCRFEHICAACGSANHAENSRECRRR